MSHPEATRIIFLHQITGRNLIERGDLRYHIACNNQQRGTHFKLWDHDHNAIGLTGSCGMRSRTNYDIPDDNTAPDGLGKLFAQPVLSPPENALSHLLEYDVIVFTSNFEVNAIRDDEQLEDYQEHYRTIRDTVAQHPDKLFVSMTPPPLSPPMIGKYPYLFTNPVQARLARTFAEWMNSAEFHQNLPNLKVFDCFDMLANAADAWRSPNMCALQYRTALGQEPYPNTRADQAVAPQLAGFICDAVEQFEPLPVKMAYA